MLPPLRSSSSSNSSYQGHALPASSAHPVTEASYRAHFVGSEGDANPGPAGRLNVLLLAGRERMADNLAMLADAIGQAIDLPRNDGETNGDYALRLAEALRKMSPAQRADVERQLNLVVQGLRLRFLFEAFNNPTGPEAARIVAYLETARFKDRDLAAKSVVTSYRQNSGIEQGGAETAKAPPSPSQAGNAQAATGTGRSTSAGSEERVSGTMMQVLMAADGQEGDDTVKHDFQEWPTDIAEMPEADDAETMFQPKIRAAALPANPDARTLQELLKKAFEGGESGDAAIEAKATAQLLKQIEDDTLMDIASGFEPVQEELSEIDFDGHFPPAADTRFARGGARAQERDIPAGQRADARVPDAGKDTAGATRSSIPAPTAIRDDTYKPILLTLKGWTEIVDPQVQSTDEILDGLLSPPASATDGKSGKAALQPSSIAASDGLSARTDAAADAERDGAMPSRADNAAATSDGPLASDLKTTTPRPQLLDLESMKALSFAAERQALAQFVVTAVNGVPYPLVAYPPVRDTPKDEADEVHHRFQDDDSDEDAADGQAGDDDDRQPEDDGQADPRDLQDLVAGAATAGDPDSAYDLYQRMAGWT